MHFPSSLTILALAATSVQAINFPSFPSLSLRATNTTADADALGDSASAEADRTAGRCPAVWTSISRELTGMFVAEGTCTNDARASIRAVFHDCFPQGGCDGSLANPVELARKDNVPMTATIQKMVALARKYRVGTADMLMFAGSHAVISCPGGPSTRTYIGRTDATGPAPDGQLPQANVGGDEALSHFQGQGFSAQDLAALIGSHTAARQFNTDPSKVGASQDSTPGIWDILYYMQTLLRTAPFSFQSDINLSKQNEVGPWMKRFAVDKIAWDRSFSAAMAKMELLGSKGAAGMVDCTSALPHSFALRSAKQSYARSLLNSISMAAKERKARDAREAKKAKA
ncbi:class II peroxidase [Venturia nashicola]|uniref:Peroxidase n=1 Tax=Venturia nashicola TaxID=86259 RepID=A0A4Z1PPW4_9PEZI|nr:class II peroxidase [Venturia nashicola]